MVIPPPSRHTALLLYLISHLHEELSSLNPSIHPTIPVRVSFEDDGIDGTSSGSIARVSGTVGA